jgi:hypothetical protein
MMTDFLYRSQQSAPSEFLKAPAGSGNGVEYDAPESQPSLDRAALPDKIAVTAYLASDDLSQCFTYRAATCQRGF